MDALIKLDTHIGLSLEDIPEPRPKNNEVLIRIFRTSLCGTDLNIYQWDGETESPIALPLVIGHEFVGEIVELGSGVSDFNCGQIVSGETHLACGKCEPCRAGLSQQCASGLYTGINSPGACAQYLALPTSALWVHSPDIDLDIATLFEPFGNAVNAATQYELKDKSVLIIGASAEGMMAAAVCRHLGAPCVAMVDTQYAKLQRALNLGATHVINVDDENLGETMEIMGIHQGFDVCLEMSGNPEAYPLVFNHTKAEGEIVLVGILDTPQRMDWRSFIFKQLTVKGIFGRKMPETWQRMAGLIKEGLDLEPIITKRIHYTQYEEGFDALKRQAPGKVVMTWEAM